MIDLRKIRAPRPKTAVHPDSLRVMEKTGEWVAQPKRNGIYSFIHVSHNGIETINRYNKPHLVNLDKVRPSLDQLSSLCQGERVFLAELMIDKVIGAKPGVMLFDLIGIEDQLLTDWTFAERYQYMLADLATHGHPIGLEIELGYGLTIARITEQLENAYTIARVEQSPSTMEGIVCKRWDAKLGVDGGSDWQVKSRIPTKKYSF